MFNLRCWLSSGTLFLSLVVPASGEIIANFGPTYPADPSDQITFTGLGPSVAAIALTFPSPYMTGLTGPISAVASDPGGLFWQLNDPGEFVTLQQSGETVDPVTGDTVFTAYRPANFNFTYCDGTQAPCNGTHLDSAGLVVPNWTEEEITLTGVTESTSNVVTFYFGLQGSDPNSYLVTPTLLTLQTPDPDILDLFGTSNSISTGVTAFVTEPTPPSQVPEPRFIMTLASDVAVLLAAIRIFGPPSKTLPRSKTCPPVHLQI